jgi:hypothetical protein
VRGGGRSTNGQVRFSCGIIHGLVTIVHAGCPSLGRA